MSTQKPTFGREDATNLPEKPKPRREELAVAWKRLDKFGNEYISVKVKLEDGKELNFKAFKNKKKESEDSPKPDFVAFKDQN